jgi:hypothetical protein
MSLWAGRGIFRPVPVLGLVFAVGCPAATERGDAVILAHITLVGNQAIDCIGLTVSYPGAPSYLPEAHVSPLSGEDVYEIAVYKGDLPDTVSLQVFGSDETGCNIQTVVGSSAEASFLVGRTVTVNLTLAVGNASDGGWTDAGPRGDASTGEDSGVATDAGAPEDAGSDASVAVDSGSISDAGPGSDAAIAPDSGAAADAGSLADAGPGPAVSLQVSGFPSPTTAGATGTFTVTALDVGGDVAIGYGGTIAFSSSDAQAQIPANYSFVAGDQGVHSFSATFETAGSQSLTATDTVTATISGTQSPIVVYGATLIQQKTNSSGSNSTLSLTLANQTTVGDLLVMIGAANKLALSGVSGGGAASWGKAASSTTNTNIEIWYGPVTSGSSAPVTITCSQTGAIWMNVSEWSGLVNTQSQVLDQGNAQHGTSSPASASSISTAHADDLVLFGVADTSGNTFGVPTAGPWSSFSSVSAGGFAQAAWYQTVSATGTYDPTVTVTRSYWDAAIAAFKIAP